MHRVAGALHCQAGAWQVAIGGSGVRMQVAGSTPHAISGAGGTPTVGVPASMGRAPAPVALVIASPVQYSISRGVQCANQDHFNGRDQASGA